MAALIKVRVSKRGKPSIIDKNNYSYVGNGGIEIRDNHLLEML